MTLKKKVVVEGLGRVTQPLRTTVPSGYGQTPIQVEKATPWQETGIGKLSQALGLGVQIAGQVKQIGDIKEEEAIRDLVNKPAEEIDKALSNNRGQFDKAQRNGLIPFGGNPWNQERVQKASGALLGDTFEVKLQEALTKAPYDSDVDGIVNEVIAEMSEEHSRLSTPAAHDGFREAIKGTIQQYKLRYNENKNAQKKDILYRSGVSELSNAFTPYTIKNEQGEDEEVTDIAKAANWWKENEGAFLPQEKLKMIKEVGVALAEKDYDAALNWVQWAGGHLKIGTALMGDPTQTDDDVYSAYASEIGGLYRLIDQINDRNEGKARGDANVLLAEINAQVTADVLALSSGNIPKDDEGNLLDTKEKIRDHYIKKSQASDNIYVQGSVGIAEIQKAIQVAELPPEEHVFKLKSSVDQLYNSSTGYKTFSQLLSDTDQTIQNTFLLDNDLIDEMTGKPTLESQPVLIGLQNLANSVRQEIANERMDKLMELSSGSYIPFGSEEVKTSSNLQGVVAKDMRAWDKHFSNEYKKRYSERLKDYNKKVLAAKAVEDAAPTGSYIEPNVSLDEKTSAFYEPNNFYDLEEAVREGNFKKSKKIAEELRESRGVGIEGAVGLGIGYSPAAQSRDLVKERILKLRGAETSLIEKDKIRRELLLYGIATEGVNLYNADSIKRGSINIADTEIKIEDKEALQDLALVYPLISKKRLQELATQKDPPAADIFELYNALFGTNLQEGVEADDLQVEAFIKQTKKLYE
jgi:hypothetical protein